MSSKRQIRRKQCEGKIRHTTQVGAYIALKNTPRDGKRMNVYRCKFCRGWHIGHAPIWTH